jgi:Tol biopolymer transport system component
MFRAFFYVFFSLLNSIVMGDEPFLKNVRQVTFSSMGFEKAGESYFSPDGRQLIFQAVPTGQKYYQIFTIDLVSGNISLVSTGKGAHADFSAPTEKRFSLLLATLLPFRIIMKKEMGHIIGN